jgi:hypothetical protein
MVPRLEHVIEKNSRPVRDKRDSALSAGSCGCRSGRRTMIASAIDSDVEGHIGAEVMTAGVAVIHPAGVTGVVVAIGGQGGIALLGIGALWAAPIADWS